MSQIGKNRIADYLFNDFQTRTGLSALNAPGAFLADLCNRRHLFSASTWRIYRAAVGHELEMSGWHALAAAFKAVPPVTKSYRAQIANQRTDLVGSKK